jgi:hypothetical protein
MAKEKSEAKQEQQVKTPDDLLESLKGKYQNCLVTGFDNDGHIYLASSVSNLPFMHWTLNRSIFELNLAEKNGQQKTPESEVDAEASKS